MCSVQAGTLHRLALFGPQVTSACCAPIAPTLAGSLVAADDRQQLLKSSTLSSIGPETRPWLCKRAGSYTPPHTAPEHHVDVMMISELVRAQAAPDVQACMCRAQLRGPSPPTPGSIR